MLFPVGAGRTERHGRSGGLIRIPGLRSPSRSAIALFAAWVAMFGWLSPKSCAMSEYNRMASVQFPDSSVETASFQRAVGLFDINAPLPPTVMAATAAGAAGEGACATVAVPIASRRM